MRRGNIRLLMVAAGACSLLVSSLGAANVDESDGDTSNEVTYFQTKLVKAEKVCKFENDLPIPATIDVRDAIPPFNRVNLTVEKTQADLGLKYCDGSNQVFPKATVYGFRLEGESEVHSPGPTFLAKEGYPISVAFDNKLQGPHLFPVDTSIHVPYVVRKDPDARPIVIHLHGGHTEPRSDGHPEAWYTKNFAFTGKTFDLDNFRYNYSNTQDATTLWYHDHTVGLTRLNNYAGTAGFYLITDDHEQELIAEGRLPDDKHTIPIMVQDKLFSTDGQLYYPGVHGEPLSPFPNVDIRPEWPNPTILDEFFGNIILVNGKVWPKHQVSPTVYRLRLLNASDTRTYVFKFETESNDAVEFYVIGSDGGLLEHPTKVDQLVMSPAERYDILVDFSPYKGSRVFLRNEGADSMFKGYFNPELPAPNGQTELLVFKKDESWFLLRKDDEIAPPTEVARDILRFDVGNDLDQRDRYFEEDCKPNCIGNLNLSADTQLGNPPILPQVVDRRRRLSLFRVSDNEGDTLDHGRSLLMLGTFEFGSLSFQDPLTEIVQVGTTEIWEFHNTTRAAHPIHVHLVEFDILNRQQALYELIDRPQVDPSDPFGQLITGAIINPLTFKLTGDEVLPQPNESGRKDTVITLPGYVTRIKANFDCTGIDCTNGEYVWHCHLLSHEDYDMMRPMKMYGRTLGDKKRPIPYPLSSREQDSNFSFLETLLGKNDEPTWPFYTKSFKQSLKTSDAGSHLTCELTKRKM
ncbi:multicopper oxidase domain-containing protein [Microbulbifer sp. MLAF003]|uniref:multicopper oxidase family protein n=1 Tax=Microbulbifer sp. MLAF003 TaxID=3032582 RepID=UPI0024AE7D25|nr:multicopper oxidase domain-containing protein [Microbulbifer sp. MLAF003]WHI53319.1 multicopper oxidase domain-containing protein [Microbulbifer sp. MLAF003]